MNTIQFVSGPLDGVSLVCADRIPESIDLGMPSLPHDTTDPETAEAIAANITGTDLDQAVFMRNVESYAYRYVLDYDEDGAPFYRYNGWSVRGKSV
jgi:hypothetical protein